MTGRDIAATVVSVGAAILATLALAAGLGSSRSEFTVALFPPWLEPDRPILSAASVGEVAWIGRLHSIVVLRGDAGSMSERLRAAGALLVFNAPFAGACGGRQNSKGKT